MMNGSRALTAAIAASFLLCAATARAEGIRVAIVDVARVLNESEAGKSAKKVLEARFEELRKGLDAKKEEAQKAKDELDSLKLLYDKTKGKEKLKAKETNFQTKMEEYQKFAQEAEKEMRTKEQEMTRSIQKTIEAKVLKIVEEEKYDLVLDSRQGGTVLHFAPAMDLSARVLELVNADASAAARPADK